MSKFSDDIMNKYIFSRFTPSKDVVVGPGMGIDVAITRLKDELFLISHLDPIVGAIKRIGWLAVHIACNDIATSGALLISLHESKVKEALQILRNSNITASTIGGVKEGEGKLLLYEENKKKLYEKPMPEKDALAGL